MSPHALIWTVAAAATVGVIIRPFDWPEAVWAVTGAALLVLSGLLSPADALAGAASGTDVYLFLAGMMLLAEVARREGLFDWLAAAATIWARGSARRLFVLICGVAIIVTTFLSNDATAVVLTPAVAAAVRAAKAPRPLPYLLICAFVANAASFVLPISNPANLVVYGSRMPVLMDWLPRYLPASALAIAATCMMLRWTQRSELRQPLAMAPPLPRLTTGGKAAALGIAATAIGLLVSSALDVPLGLPTAVAGVLTAAFVLIETRTRPWPMLAGISWGVLPLVAGLFVLVRALEETGLIAALSAPLRDHAADQQPAVAWAAGATAAVISNLVNNLPAGLVAGAAVVSAQAPELVTRAILIGVNLGPNLSVTGSLATILWLAALRREGVNVNAVTFFRLGLVVMPPALVLALAGTLLWR
ncbi:MAG: arsenic transporter [Bradyrhizobiaceae bacterium]|nr:arsenic transporter [Bradyrhizobiaceae bacterium]